VKNSHKLNRFAGKQKNKTDSLIRDLENQGNPVTFEAILKEYKAGSALNDCLGPYGNRKVAA
jgi:hypothetical protein